MLEEKSENGKAGVDAKGYRPYPASMGVKRENQRKPNTLAPALWGEALGRSCAIFLPSRQPHPIPSPRLKPDAASATVKPVADERQNRDQNSTVF